MRRRDGVTVLAHLRYVAEAMNRMTEAALSGRREDMYPGGRENDRPATLLLREGRQRGISSRRSNRQRSS